MELLSLESIVILLLCIGIIIGLVYWYTHRIKELSSDLELFKKEKEYQDEVMIVLGENNSIVYANQAAKVLFSLDKAYKKTHYNSNVTLQIDSSSKAGDFFEVIEKELKNKKHIFHFKNALLGISGKMKQVNLYIDKSVWSKEKTITCIIDMKSNDIVNSDAFKQDGAIDFFTGLPSQFSALTDINSLIMKKQNSTINFTLFLFGIDNFREIQSTLGLGFTNQIIKKIATYFKAKIDDETHIYRMDGDKFLMVVEKIVDNALIRQLAKDTILDIQNLYKKDSPVPISSSVGIVKFPENGENALKLINYVYIALGESEKDNRSNIKFFSIDYQSMEIDIVRMSEEIRNALKKSEFVLYYQPIFSLRNESLVGAEALIRWEHPELGVIPADKFLDAAKKSGLMVEIGEYVFNEAILQRKKWDAKGLNKFPITVNISLEEMQVDKLIDKLDILFKQHGVDPKNFNLDTSENDAMTHPEKTAMDFKMFKDLGLSITIDNFGSGATSIIYLEQFSLSMIKIDRALIFDLASNVSHQTIVKTIIILAHTLNIEVVAEGVETSKELSLLYEYKCDYAQGYLFSKPLPVKEFEDLFSE
jgi:diguanylate cyclase (GGDEF)-like protein